MKITDLQSAQRPREKLLALGAESLSDAELLAIFLRTGITGVNAIELADQLLQQFGSLRALLNADQHQFCQGKGLGVSKYVQLCAVLEMVNRYLSEKIQKVDVFDSAETTKAFLLAKLRDKPYEVFAILTLDAQHRLLHYRPMFRGTIDSASVYPRTIAQQALADNAAAVILAHNHPSGVAEPSRSDEQITRRITDALALLDIRVLDHLVVGDGEVISLAQRGLL